MWNNYPDGMRESDIPGYNEYDITINAECGAPDVTLGFVDLDHVNAYILKIYNLVNKEFLKGKNPDLGVVLTRLDELKKIVNNPVKTEVHNCPFDDEVEAVGDGSEIYWTCPWCESEHQFTRDRDDY